MTKYTSRKLYFKDLAISHPTLNHGATITEDGINRLIKSFIQVATEVDSLNAAVVNELDFPFVAQVGFNGGLSDRDGDIRNRYQNRLQFLTKAATSDSFPQMEDAVDNAYETAYTIMEQWIQRMYYDMENGCPCPFKLDFNSFSWSMIGPIADQFYGWELNFSDDEHANNITNGVSF